MSSNSKRMRSIPMVVEDRISNLPDEILCHVLSSLPSKLAASTIILSKRWKPLWFSVRSLDFEDLTFTDISSAMFSRDFTTTPILSFRFKRRQCLECLEGLKCGDSYTFALNICLYISYLSRRLENLDLDLSGSLCRKDLPSCVFNCRTLVVLKLKKVAVFHLPQVDFPRLKTLHLNQVCFQRYQDVTKFLYGCPILENLQTKVLSVIDSNGLVSMEKFEAIPNLIKAKISDQFIPAALVREAKFLQANLTIRSFPVDQFPMFHNLTHMELFFNYTTCSSYKRKWNWLIQVLEHCPKLQHLIIHEDFADGNNSWKDPPLVPECLSSELRRCSLRSCNSMDSDQLQFAEYIVQNSKVLETMIIKTDRSLDMLIKSSSWTKCSATCKLVIC